MLRRRGAIWTAAFLTLLLVRSGGAAPKAAEGRRKAGGSASVAEASKGSGGQKPAGRRGKSRARSRGAQPDALESELELEGGKPDARKGARLAAPTPLDGTRWLLDSYRTRDGQTVAPIEGSQLTAQFQAGRLIAGSAGCNDFTAGYTWDAGRLTVSRPARTRKACPKALIDQEEGYLAALHRVAGFTRSDQGLVLDDARGAAVATFRREPPPVLTGPVWRMTAYNDGKGDFASARRDVVVTAIFGPDGQLTGSGGCNDYRAKYTQDGDTLTLGPIILLTKKPCAGEIRDQERAFLGSLRSATRVEAEGSQLLLTRPGGMRIASFTPEPAPGAAPADQGAAPPSDS
jgi:heat shock protein HslJ